MNFLKLQLLNSFFGAAQAKGKIAMFKGQKVQTSKVMICTKNWLQNNFLGPFERESPKLKVLQQQGGSICSQAQRCEHFERLDRQHCIDYKHPCPYQQSCWSLTDQSHLKFYTHNNHLPKCPYHGTCKKLKDPAHRAQCHHTGMRDYMIRCRYGAACRDKGDNLHDHKYYHD